MLRTFAFTLAQCNTTFAAQRTYSTGSGSGPASVFITDVNSDNKPDIIVANHDVGNVGVLLNFGNGTFRSQQTYPTGSSSYPNFVFVIDVNSDSKSDIIVANQAKNNVGVLLNSGNGTFLPQKTYSTGSGSGPASLSVADVNNDSKPDIIVVNYEGNSVGTLLNLGNGTFGSQTIYSIGNGSNPQAVFTVDVDNDGNPDIIVGNHGTSSVSVFLNFGNGTFRSQKAYSVGNQSMPYSVSAADVNGDEKPDIVVANKNLNNVGVLLNSGDGTFLSQATYSTGSGSAPTSVSVVDVTNDGKPDIVVANYNTNKVAVLRNSGNGTFLSQETYSVGLNPWSVSAVDVNSDGKPDIIVANIGDNSVSVLLAC